MKISIVTFSPTGGTLKCATELAASMGEIIQRIDLTDFGLAELAVSDEADVLNARCLAFANGSKHGLAMT